MQSRWADSKVMGIINAIKMGWFDLSSLGLINEILSLNFPTGFQEDMTPEHTSRFYEGLASMEEEEKNTNE